ncbi:predicted protein [Lichtheimia corymbifera JMRC:FSU:9682]|uniref:Uncharacterized protein n=1 Tax=Lichtheimia corymbifera JMRC:FSU:9682 TaxID=1263082 RepID=A0A068RPE4_9FUNG|nr:predicted protein [Lichtheimia corymbifera JMRC:FSU:9682]
MHHKNALFPFDNNEQNPIHQVTGSDCGHPIEQNMVDVHKLYWNCSCPLYQYWSVLKYQGYCDGDINNQHDNDGDSGNYPLALRGYNQDVVVHLFPRLDFFGC